MFGRTHRVTNIIWSEFFIDISTFSVRGCWGQPMLLFWKLGDETQMPTTHEATRHHNSKKYWSFSVSLVSLWDTLYLDFNICMLLLFWVHMNWNFKTTYSNEYDNFTIFSSLCRGSCYDNNSTIKSLFKTIAEIRNFAMFKTT